MKTWTQTFKRKLTNAFSYFAKTRITSCFKTISSKVSGTDIVASISPETCGLSTSRLVRLWHILWLSELTANFTGDLKSPKAFCCSIFNTQPTTWRPVTTGKVYRLDLHLKLSVFVNYLLRAAFECGSGGARLGGHDIGVDR